MQPRRPKVGEPRPFRAPAFLCFLFIIFPSSSSRSQRLKKLGGRGREAEAKLSPALALPLPTMETIIMPKHRSGDGSGSGGTAQPVAAAAKMQPLMVAASTVLVPSADTDGDADDFFDLEFTVPDEGDEEGGGEDDDSEDEAEEDGRESDFTLSSDGSYRGYLRSDPSVSLSPSDDLFFKGRLLPLDSATFEPSSKAQFPASLLKSANKLRVLMLRFKKSKSTAPEANGPSASTVAVAVASPKQQQSKLPLKFKVEEVPVVSLFTRDNSLRSCGGGSGRPTKLCAVDGKTCGLEGKRNSKDVVQRYLSKIKPLYVRVAKRYGEKLAFSGQLSSSGKVGPIEGGKVCEEPASGATKVSKGPKVQAGNIPAGLRVVCKRLGKSRSASSAVAAVRSPPLPQRRDDSLLQLEDGIQSAIAHCKRSFHATKRPEAALVRSNSDPSDATSEKVQG